MVCPGYYEEESAVLGLGNTIVMPAGVMNVPVVSVAPSAVFVATGARKPATTIEWTAETLQPEEIALTLYIPDAYINDAGFPVWESVRTEVAKAIGKTLDAAVLYGTGAPASYPTGGIAALAGTAQVGHLQVLPRVPGQRRRVFAPAPSADILAGNLHILQVLRLHDHVSVVGKADDEVRVVVDRALDRRWMRRVERIEGLEVSAIHDDPDFGKSSLSL